MNKDYWKKVSIGGCVKTIIISIIVMCIIFIPINFDGKIVLTISKLPLIGDGTIVEMAKAGMGFIVDLAKFPDRTANILNIAVSYGYYIFFGALIADILFAILLIIFKNNVMRIIFKVFSIIFGVLIVLVALINLAVVVGYFYAATIKPKEYPFITMLKTSGVTTYFAIFIFGLFLSIQQFKWFSKAF